MAISMHTTGVDQFDKTLSQHWLHGVISKERAKQIAQQWKAGVVVLALVLCPHNVWVGIDQLACCIFFGRADLTVSGLSAVVERADSGEPVFAQRLEALKLGRLQIVALRRIGGTLEWLSPGHCERSRLKDLARAERATDFLISVRQGAARAGDAAMAVVVGEHRLGAKFVGLDRVQTFVTGADLKNGGLQP